MWLLLLLPFIGLLWVPITAFLIWLVYRDGQRKGVK